MTEWKEYKLGDLIDVKHGFAFKGEFITTEPTQDVLITPGNFKIGGGFKVGKSKYYKGEYPNSYALKEGDVVVTMTDLSQDGDTLGYSAKIPKYEGGRFLHNQRIGLVNVISNEVNKEFIYWVMRTYEYHGFVVGAASGTSIRHTSPSSIKEYAFDLPSPPEQEFITSVLNSFDRKIELLHRQNKILETLAETLFRQWFTENAGHNWETGKLGRILDTIESGSRPKGGIDPELREGIPSIGAESINGIGYYDYGKTKFITSDFFNKMNRGIVKDYDVLVYKDGAYIGRKSMFGRGFPYEKCSVNEHVFILRSNENANQFFLYFLLKQEELEQLNANSAQPGLNQESMRSFEIKMPPQSKIDSFGQLAKPWVDKIFFNCNQIRTLAQLRDALLPKLMSGEVRVSE